MILVSHAYLGGTRLEWWKEYQKALSSPGVSWKGFNQWIAGQSVISLSNADIPLNKEVKYGAPKPAKPIEEYEPMPGLGTAEDSSTATPGAASSVCQ